MADQEPPQITELSRIMLHSTEKFKAIAADHTRDYYASNDWSDDFYCMQAVRGLIAVATTISGNELLLPQLQFSYCVLPLVSREPESWKSVLKKSKGKSYRIRVNHDFNRTLDSIMEYHGDRSWITPQYKQLLRRLYTRGPISSLQFQICSIELYNHDDQLVAGEIGYVIGSTFTSLTGFCVRSRSESLGKLQIISLAHLLKKCGFTLLNAGQPPSGTSMAYKAELGGVEISRTDFLEAWKRETGATPILRAEFVNANILIDNL